MRWEIYDELIEGISDSVYVGDYVQKNWWLVKTETNMGIAMYFEQGKGLEVTLPKNIISMSVKGIAKYVKSWNFYEATLGMAAINAYYNNKEKVEKLNPVFSKNKDETIFVKHRNKLYGKKVAVIGHFPLLEEIKPICKLSVLEKNPQTGDYPDSACEYILEDQDYIFITGTTLPNKTLPRLLELSGKAKVVLVGPSVPLTSVMFKYGIDMLGGCVVQNQEAVWRAVVNGSCRGIFKNGVKMLYLEKERL